MRALIRGGAARAAVVAALVAATAAAASPAVVSGGPLDGSRAVWLGRPPPHPPRRVVTLAPSLTDVLVAMGFAGRVVGVTTVDKAPEVAGVARVGGFVDPSPEAILALRPDLVLWTYNAGALPSVRRLAELRGGASQSVPVLALPAETLTQALATPGIVGEALGEPAAGRALEASMRAGLERFRARARQLPPKRVLFVIWRQPLLVAGPGSFPDELLRVAGFHNVVTTGPRWPVYAMDRAVADDPELVIDSAVEEPEFTVRQLDVLPAVRRGKRFALRSDELQRPGPKMVQALDELLVALGAGTLRGSGAAPDTN